MKTIINLSKSVFVSLLIFCCSCSESDDLPQGFEGDRATVTGLDVRRCACCGGWFIDINNEQYRFSAIPFSTMIDFENATFPLEVAVVWSIQQDGCLGDEIDVSSIQRIE